MELDFTSDTIEKLLFRKTLTDKGWLGIMSGIFDPRWFRVRTIAAQMSNLIKYYEKYGSVPSPKVVQLMSKKYAEAHPGQGFSEAEANAVLDEAMKLDLGVSDDVVAANLKEFIRKNTLSNSLLDNITLITQAETEKDADKYQKVIDKCLEKFDKVQKLAFADSDLGMNYFAKDDMDRHWDFLRNPDAKLATQWEALDSYTNGGFLKKGRMLALFMAQAGLGKSVFLSNLAVNFLKQNMSVVVISLEMSQDVYAQRFDAHISKKNINRLRESESAARERLAEFYGKYPDANLFIKEFPPRSVTTNHIDAYLEKLKNAGNRIDVVIVDYLNLVLPNKASDSMFKDGMSVSEELRALSYKYEVPVISATQSNSEGMNSADIDMQHVSESRGIVHTVDFLGAIYQTEDLRNKGQLGFKILKNRLGGMVGKRLAFVMDPATLVVSDVTFDKDRGTMTAEPSESEKLFASLPDIKADIMSA